MVCLEMLSSGAFILPSLFEPWGVVVHEAVLSKLPLLLSEQCGSSEVFLERDNNGYSFDSNDLNSMKSAIRKIMNCDESERRIMGEKSYALAHKISIEKCANQILQLI